jgi:hypothetical protein
LPVLDKHMSNEYMIDLEHCIIAKEQLIKYYQNILVSE